MSWDLEGEARAAAEREPSQQRHAKRSAGFRFYMHARKHFLQKAVAIIAVDYQTNCLDLRLHTQVELAPLLGDKPIDAHSLNGQPAGSGRAEQNEFFGLLRFLTNLDRGIQCGSDIEN